MSDKCCRASGQAVGGPVERLWSRRTRLTSNVGWGCCGTDKVRDITRQTDIDWVEDVAVWETRNIQQLLQGSRTGCGHIYCNQVPTKKCYHKHVAGYKGVMYSYMLSVCQKIFSHFFVRHCYQVDPYNEIVKPTADTFQKMFTYCLTCFSITANLKCHSSRPGSKCKYDCNHAQIYYNLAGWRLIYSTPLQHIGNPFYHNLVLLLYLTHQWIVCVCHERERECLWCDP